MPHSSLLGSMERISASLRWAQILNDLLLDLKQSAKWNLSFPTNRKAISQSFRFIYVASIYTDGAQIVRLPSVSSIFDEPAVIISCPEGMRSCPDEFSICKHRDCVEVKVHGAFNAERVKPK